MASGESQKHLLSLIRNIASEKSQEELRVSDLKKRLLELQNDLNVANADLDGAKRSREMAEQELRGSQVQVSMIGASIQAQEARISLLQQEILKLRSDLDALNSEVGFMRDEFVKSMCELNKKIRQFQEITVNAFQMEQPGQLCSDNGFLKGLEDNITCLSTQMHELEAEYEKERHDHDKVCEELAHVERRWFLVTAIMEETKQLQELAEYLSWRRYMLLLGRTCRRSAHVQAVDQTTLKTRELKPPEVCLIRYLQFQVKMEMELLLPINKNIFPELFAASQRGFWSGLNIQTMIHILWLA
ncbi:hypothetical protein MUK42_09163 [Musa troglodytarum]|uniref:Uncharacterized protein n=1 Tax=Musa troglodytarum TaxID=320322 RepID=A0A9E7I3I5_9LILI|nr:hypothetical protein MUK42_09163 [Musa troglodytarum]